MGISPKHATREPLLYVLVGAAGLLVWLRGLFSYYRFGFNGHLWTYWLAGMVLLAVAAFFLAGRDQAAAKQLAQQKQDGPAASGRWLTRADWLIIGVLLLVFAPLYMYNVHDFPRQMNTDEIAIMNTERVLAADPNADIYGPSFYSDLPTMIFWVLGKLGVMLGGVNLAHMRLLHAASGVIIILLLYIFLRILRLPRTTAVAGTVIVAVCHSLFFLSRMAMRDNTAVLFELVAFILLFYAWHRRHYGWAMVAGFACGLTVYTYFPSRITLAVWLAFSAATLVLGRLRDWRAILSFNAVVLLGAVVVAAPLFVGSINHIPTDPYATHQFLWQPEAREQERQFRQVPTVGEAMKINITHGLAAFNRPYHDQGMIYLHPGFGFVDAMTGVLIWLGVLAVVVRSAHRRNIREADLFVLVGFLAIWLSMAFLLTRAPDYTRLLVVLPFVAYLCARAIGIIGRLLQLLAARYIKRISTPVLIRALPLAVAVVLVSIVTFLNGLAVQDYRHVADVGGDGVGDTLRFQETRTHEDAQYLFVYGPTYYFYWGIPEYWRGWMTFPKGEQQPLNMVPLESFAGFDTSIGSPDGHGYLLTTGDVWQQIEANFRARESVVNVHKLDPAGNRVAVEYVDWN